MKKVIGMIVILTIIILTLTSSEVVQLTDAIIIAVSTSIISIIYNVKNNNRKLVSIIGSSALLGVSLSCIFYILVMAVDYYIKIQGVPDGRFLTWSETFLELADDLTFVIFFSTCLVTIVSFIVTTIYSKFYRKAS
jgi:hypothetical protein